MEYHIVCQMHETENQTARNKHNGQEFQFILHIFLAIDICLLHSIIPSYCNFDKQIYIILFDGWYSPTCFTLNRPSSRALNHRGKEHVH